MRIIYKTHYILQQAPNKFVAMRHSMYNVGTFPSLDLAMRECDKK